MAQPAAPQRVRAAAKDIGEGLTVRRALPGPQRRMVGAWCFLDHAGPVRFGPGQGLHVGAHPHIGLQTFTWMIDGEFVHRDSLGCEQVLRPGQVNLMTAGRGVVHTEDSVRDGASAHAAQLWIALPEAERQRAPAFDHHPELPRVALGADAAGGAGGWQATVLAGSAHGHTAPARVCTPLVGVDYTAAGAASAQLPLREAFEHAVLVLRGSARVGGEALEPGTLLYFAPGRTALALQCDAPAQVLLLGGEPFPEDIILWWNFVARTQAEIEAAVADWNAGRFAPCRPGSPAPPLRAPATAGLSLRASR